MQQFRPICLLNFIYKLITEVLTIRLEKVVDRLISYHQSAFIKGRNIVDGIIALHEIMHGTWQRTVCANNFGENLKRVTGIINKEKTGT